MKKIKYFAFVLIMMMLASCGGGKNGIIKVVSERINGPLGDYFEVVNKDYKVTDKGTVGIEFKRIKAGFPAPWNENMKVGYSDGYFEPLFTAEFQDKDGNTLSKYKMDIVWDREELEELAALRENESTTLKFDVQDKETCLVKITSTFEVNGANNPVDVDQDDSDDVELNAYIYDADGDNDSDYDFGFSDSGSADWDKILDEYEQYVNKYYSFAEKVSKGNASAMADALSMSEKAASLVEKLERAEDNLSTAQANRLLKIQNKMAQAAAKMAGAASKVEDMMDDLEDMDVEDLLNNMPEIPDF
jgi:hypothetical protein